jgi:hypothetical protein
MRLTRTWSGVAGALLVTFHGWLLASQALDGRLTEPGLLLRWGIAAVLVAALVVVPRQGVGLASRKAMAIWALAAMLHGPAVASHSGEAFQNAVASETVAAAVLQIAVAATLTLTLWLFAALLLRHGQRPARTQHRAFGWQPTGALAAACSPPFSPRPPPRA